ncbi:MAG: ParB/RepB/Spo0J family partition protein [bacterium]|jgi:flagellar motor protein MotB
MPPSKSGSLGRGLGELIGGIPATIASAATISSTGFVRLSPDLIGLPPEREAQAQEVSAELVESIRTHGILQPILVRRCIQGYEVVVGARRLVAARLAGLKELPAVIVQVTVEEAQELSKVENSCRENVRQVLPVVEPVVPMEVVEEQRNWDPMRVVMFGVVGILLLMLGAGMGLGIGRSASAELSVDNPRAAASLVSEPIDTSVAVTEEPLAVPKPPELDVSEFKALESEGVSLVMESNGMAQVTFDVPLFSSRAALADAGGALLKKLGAIFINRGAEWVVVVTGHTDAIPLRGSGLYRDNQELGLARATEVVRYLIREAHVPAAMLHAVTAGEDNPPFPGDDADSRRKNRTVTLQVSIHQ